MGYELRAMSLGEIIGTSFRLVREQFVPLVGMSAAVYLPFTFLMTGWQMKLETAVEPGGRVAPETLMVDVAAALLTMGVVMPIVSAAVAHAVGEAYLGRRVDVGESLREALGIVLPLAGTAFLAGLITLAGVLLFVVPGIWFALGIVVLASTNVMERSFGMTSIRRSLDLMKGQRGRGFLLSLFVAAVSGVLGGVLGGVGILSPWVGALAQGVASSVAGAFTGAVFIVFYFDLRCRKEAFDAEHLARLVEGGEPAST